MQHENCNLDGRFLSLKLIQRRSKSVQTLSKPPSDKRIEKRCVYKYHQRKPSQEFIKDHSHWFGPMLLTHHLNLVYDDRERGR